VWDLGVGKQFLHNPTHKAYKNQLIKEYHFPSRLKLKNIIGGFSYTSTKVYRSDKF